jgi:hypothetical protein
MQAIDGHYQRNGACVVVLGGERKQQERHAGSTSFRRLAMGVIDASGSGIQISSLDKSMGKDCSTLLKVDNTGIAHLLVFRRMVWNLSTKLNASFQMPVIPLLCPLIPNPPVRVATLHCRVVSNPPIRVVPLVGDVHEHAGVHEHPLFPS